MARKKKFQLGDRNQKRGCATVPVPRDDVLVNGRVPKGCRFHPDKGNGTILCTPAIAQKVGVLDIERKKPVPKAGKLTKRSYCYKPDSPYPYRRDGELKQGCEEDEETGKICCDRSYFRRPKAAAKTARSKKKKKAASKKAAPKKKTTARRAAPKKTARKKTASKKKTSRKRTSRKRGQQNLFGVEDRFDDSPPLADVEMAPVAALAPGVGMDAFELALAASTPASATGSLALLDDSGDGSLALGRSRAGEFLPSDIPMPEAHLQTFSDFAVTYAAGTVLAGAGLAATYELVDRMDYFDDKPVARAGAFVGMGAIPAALAWWLSQDSEYGPEIRTLAAGWGIAFTAIGGLGLIKTMLEKKAADTEDPDDRKSLEDTASHIPFPSRHRHDDEPEDADIVEDEGPDGEGPDEDDEIATDDTGGDDTGTAGVTGYPNTSFYR